MATCKNSHIPQKIWNTSAFEGGEFKSPDFGKKRRKEKHD
jgi:hypothetical protein